MISLFGFDPGSRPAGEFRSIDGVVHFLSATAGPLLARLAEPFELVWCTGCEEKANEYLPAFLGLPGPLPFLTFERNPGRSHGHWKLGAIDAYAGQSRALAWIDDAFDDACARWAAARAAPTLLVSTDPARGITTADADALEAWAARP